MNGAELIAAEGAERLEQTERDLRQGRVRVVLFDIDGTLIHTRGVGIQAFARAFEAEFARAAVTDTMRFGGRTDPSLVRELFASSGVEFNAENLRRFFDAYVFWLDHLLIQSREGGPCPGVVQFIESLRRLPASPVLGLLTGNIRLGAEIKLRRFGLWELFQVGAFGDDHEDRNEIARVAHGRASEHYGRELLGEEILVVGDTAHDIACGRAIGARVLAVATGAATEAVLMEHRADWVLASLVDAEAGRFCD